MDRMQFCKYVIKIFLIIIINSVEKYGHDFGEWCGSSLDKILSWELQLYQLIIPQQPICNNGLIQCNYNPNIWNTFDYWNEIFCKSKDPSRPWDQMNWTSQ